MFKLTLIFKHYILLTALYLCSISAYAQSNTGVKLGAYYFDGWKPGSAHITKALVDSFVERKPIWGWATSNQLIMDKQITIAKTYGLDFFNFCWYYNQSQPIDSLNRALMFYRRSPNKNKLQYCLMVANHAGYEIGPQEWPVVTNEWIKQFKSKEYLTVDGKPLLIFFTLQGLINKFGSVNNIRNALNDLRARALSSGLKGVSVGLCIALNLKEVEIANKCGFDLLTGYNYHPIGFTSNTHQASISQMRLAETNIWNRIASISKLKYIPATTLNWDPRPWANAQNKYTIEPYYVNYSGASVYASVINSIKWVRANSSKTPEEKIIFLYAWNEYGEGGWLTPSQKLGNSLLNGLKKAKTAQFK